MLQRYDLLYNMYFAKEIYQRDLPKGSLEWFSL